MTVSLHQATSNRLLVIVSPGDVSGVLSAEVGRPIVALLAAHNTELDLPVLDPVIVSLLETGCEYFVCFGRTSESLHDRIDDIVVERSVSEDRAVVTTWHDDETAAEVAEFFINVAGAKERSLMLAVLGPNDDGLAHLLVKQVTD